MNTILKQFAACCLVECPVVVDASALAGETNTVEHESNSTTPGSHPSGMYVPEEGTSLFKMLTLFSFNVSRYGFLFSKKCCRGKCCLVVMCLQR